MVEDNRIDAELVFDVLRHGGLRLEAVRVDTREDYLAELAKSPDVVLCDYNLPSFNAVEALELLRKQGRDTPFIVLSGSIGEETAVDMIKRGADDYLLKDRIGRLDASIRHALEQKALREEARLAEEQLRQSEHKYRCLFDHLMDAAYVCEAGGLRIIDVNRQGEQLLGVERAAILGSRLGQYFPEGSLDRLQELAEDGSATRFETVCSAGAGDRVQVSATRIVIAPRHFLLVLLRPLAD